MTPAIQSLNFVMTEHDLAMIAPVSDSLLLTPLMSLLVIDEPFKQISLHP